jgi:hypothetical protein
MPAEKYDNWQVIWNGLCVLASLTYLGIGWWPATLITVLICVSCALRYGRRWLMRGGFALSVLAIWVSIAPTISVRILELVQYVPQVTSLAKAAVSSQVSAAQ